MIRPLAVLLVLVSCASAAQPARYGRIDVYSVNGTAVDDTCLLRDGANDLLVAYEPPVRQKFSPEHAGPMFRVVDVDGGRRVEEVRFQP